MWGARDRPGRRVRRLHDIPAFGAPVELVWRSRRHRCLEPRCAVEGFSEDHDLAVPRAKLTTRAAWWAISCLRSDTASVAAVARRLGVDWHTVWDAVAVLDAFHVVKLGLQAMEETRRRVQQEQVGHRGRKHDPLYRIRNVLRAGAEKLTARQVNRIDAGLQAGDPSWEVTIAWQAYQRLRSSFATKDLREGLKITQQVLESFHTCPVPEIARLGRTLRSWSEQFLAYFTTGRANNGGTEAVNGIIELHRRIARGFRNPVNYRLRMILAAGQAHPTHPNLR